MTRLLLPMLLAAGAPPDYSQSRFEGPATARERDVVEYVLTVRNTGEQPSTYLEAEVALPALALRVSGDLPFEAADHAFLGPLALAPGEQRELRFRAIAAEGTDGTILAPMATIRAVPGGTVLHASTQIEPRRAVGDLVPLFGPYQATRAGVLVLGFLALAPLVVGAALAAAVFARRGRTGLGPLPAARIVRSSAGVLVAVGFLLIFAGLGLEDARLLRHYRHADCEVLDSSADVTLQTSRRQTTAHFKPVVAVRFRIGGDEVIGTGFDGPTRIRMGGVEALGRELRPFPVGASVPCWYDPEDPARIVVRRGPGAAYAFALLPVGLLVLTVAMLRRAVWPQSRSQS